MDANTHPHPPEGYEFRLASNYGDAETAKNEIIGAIEVYENCPGSRRASVRRRVDKLKRMLEYAEMRGHE